MSDKSFGPLPALEEPNTFFWTAGKDGQLLIQQCGECAYWLHPPGYFCPQCQSENIQPQVVSGLGSIVAVTVNYQPWMPKQQVPYVVALVELDEQAGLRLTTNSIGVEPEAVAIGQRVKVVFEQREDVWMPLFTPIA